MRDFVKRLWEIEQYAIGLDVVVKGSVDISSGEQQLSLTRATLAKAMLGVVEDGVVVEVAHYAGLHDVIHQFAGDGSQWYRPVAGSPFLNTGTTSACRQAAGTVPWL